MFMVTIDTILVWYCTKIRKEQKMFNTYKGGDTNTQVNSVSGTIIKSYAKSFFVRFEIGTDVERRLFDINARIFKDGHLEPVVVIQAMIVGENMMLAELMWEEDYEAALKELYD